MVNTLSRLKSAWAGFTAAPSPTPDSTPETPQETPLAVIPVDSLPNAAIQQPTQVTDFTGDKFLGGFGVTNWYLPDYWTLRARSKQLFQDNLYAKGIIRRYVTNIINTGLMLEATPEEGILGMQPDDLAEWSETQENLFGIWGKNPKLCDFKNRLTFGQIQAEIKRQALINGDVLVVLRTDPVTNLPRVQLIDADVVQTPTNAEISGNRKIIHGVEVNDAGEHIAYHIRQADGVTFKRLSAFGARSGRRQAWLEYGTEKMHEEVRGEPILSVILQSLREIDRYRDAAQRKAVVNAIFAMFIKKGENKISSLPVTGGATHNATSNVTDSNASSTSSRDFTFSNQLPGAAFQELQEGEEPVLLGGQGTDINFPTFEDAMISAIAWSLEIPPEILKLSFNNNYSASQAALNEFKILLNKERQNFGANVNQKIYVDWFISSTLTGKVKNVGGFLESWRDPLQYDTFGAWISAEWAGAIKPTTDILKQAKGYDLMIEMGAITRDRASKEMTGTKYSKNVKKLARENKELAVAREPLMAKDEEEPSKPIDIDALALAVSEILADDGEGLTLVMEKVK